MSKKTTKAKYHTTPADLLVAAAYLPKTRDGKPMYPGMGVWLVGTDMSGEETGDMEAEVTSVATDHVWVKVNIHGDQEQWAASQIYSSKEAAGGVK